MKKDAAHSGLRLRAHPCLRWLAVSVLCGLGCACAAAPKINTALPAAMEANQSAIAVIKEVRDLDAVVIEVEGKPILVGLANLLPLHRWPADLTDGDKAIQAAEKSAIGKMLVGQRVFAIVVQRPSGAAPAAVDLETGGSMSSGPIDRPWKGELPSEQRNSFEFDLNTEMVQLGYTRFIPQPERDGTVTIIYQEAEGYARQGRLGIWADPDLPLKLRE